MGIDTFRVYSPNPGYMVNKLRSGANAQIAVTGCGPGRQVFIGVSFAGGGPIATQFGPLGMSVPFGILFSGVANANGEFTVAAPIPVGVVGIPLWTQACEITPGGSPSLTNALAMTIL